MRRVLCYFTGLFCCFSSCVQAQYTFDMVWEEATPLYQEILNHPFVIEMAEGSLPREKYNIYTEQDVLYLKYDSEAFKIASEYAPNEFEKTYLFNEHIKMEKYVQQYLEQRANSIIDPLAECETYSQYVLKAVHSQNYYYMTGVLTPCIISYSYIANHYIDLIDSSHPYSGWFIYYYQNLGRIVGNAKKVINSILQDANDVEYKDFLNGFKESMKMETLFWDGMYRSSLTSNAS